MKPTQPTRILPSAMIATLVMILAAPYCPGTVVQPFLTRQLAEHLSVRDLAVRFDGREAYISSQSLLGEISAIMRLEWKDGEWGTAELASFSGAATDLEPFLAPDGLRLYFVSNRPRPGEASETGDFDIWYVQRSNLGADWGDPVNLGEPVNTEGNEFYPAVAADGDLYFTSDGPGSVGQDDIFYSRYRNGQYEPPKSLSEAINTEGYEFNAFVAPDESYLIFTAYNREDGLGSGDLYISRRNESGDWSPASNLGREINSERMDYCPFVDAAGMLFFTSKRADFPEPPYGADSAQDWLEIIHRAENGQSRLYRVADFQPGDR